jgi:hypothetical protein
VLEEKKKVQPFYIIDPARNSLGVEIQSMDRIKKIIKQKYPDSESCFLHTTYVHIETIEPDEEISKAYDFLRKYVPLGSQYEWLPRFCKQHDFQDVELAVENVTNDQSRWADSNFIKNNYSDDPSKLSKKERLIYMASKTLYERITFPIIQLTKENMIAIARKKGWMPILEKTWFCCQPLYLPFRGLTPCGNCITCRLLTKSGLEWRIPFYVKLFQQTRKFKNRLTGFKKTAFD